ncbi:hypothetical protein [Pseudomonas fluvialis]|uniref:hypothetical protein n=1 Tax=Pseudomonas fluvialis TaxID=1793966 RepID=UPI0035B41ADA
MRAYSTGLGVALFSRASQRASGASAGRLSIKQLEAAYQELTQGMKNAPALEVVQSAADLPFDAPADAKGVHLRGVVYLVADNITSAQDAREVIAHEMIGHFGLTGFFGRELVGVLGEIHRNNPRVRMLAGRWRGENADLIAQWKGEYGMTDAQVQTRSTEEALATMAERGERLKGWKRLAAVLQTLLRKMGATRWANALEARTDAEALLALKKAEMFVRRGVSNKSPWPELAFPMFLRALTPEAAQIKALYRLSDTKAKGIPLFSARAIAKKVMAATGLNAKDSPQFVRKWLDDGLLRYVDNKKPMNGSAP